MSKNTSRASNQLIVQALNAAETNIKLAKQLLGGGGGVASARGESPRELPGVIGTFDGENMITKDGQKFRVNPNYASKSVLVYGDTLKKIEEDGREKFKQIQRVKRQRVEGILSKKDGKFVAVTPDGSYKVSETAVEFYGGQEGAEVVVVLPLESKNVPFAAIELIEEKEKAPAKKKVESPLKKVKEVLKKETPKKKAPEKVEKEVVKEAVKPEPVAGDEELR